VGKRTRRQSQAVNQVQRNVPSAAKAAPFQSRVKLSHYAHPGLFAGYCHQVYTSGVGLLSLPGHASMGRDGAHISSP
jgi:hypothetical protein